MIALIFAGLVSMQQLRRETFPDFLTPEVEIRVPYPGATAEEVEEAICRRIEDALDGVRFVKEVRSEARDGMAAVTVEMTEGGQYRPFKDEIDTAIAAMDDLPIESEEPIISELNTIDPVLSILVAGPMSAADLKLYAEDLKDRIQKLPVVSLVTIDGFSDHQLRVELSSEATLRYGLSGMDVANVIRRQSVDLPAGVIEAEGQEVVVRISEERVTADELADLVVVSDVEGSEIRISDLGVVVDDFEEAEEKVIMAGQRAALLRIEKTKNEDTIVVADAVKEFLERERQLRPQVKLVVVQDISTLIQDRLIMLLRNGWQGAILVFLTMWLFFNVRLSFWVVASLPVSFLGAFILVPHFDLTINMITLVGLLLALGILMDDGIVIAENVASHRALGKSSSRAAIDGVAQVAPGVISSFLTTLCVLGPLAFLSGRIGRVLEVVPMILIMVLSVSLIEAFMILPSHLGHSLRGDQTPGWMRLRIDHALDTIRSKFLVRLIDRLIRWRYLWLGCVLGSFILSIALAAGGVIKFQAFPEIEGDTVVARVLMPAGTPLEQTEQIVARMTAALNRVNNRLSPDQPQQQALVESTYAKFSENVDAFEKGSHVATIYAALLNAETRSTSIDDLIDDWKAEIGLIPDAVAITYTEPTLGPAGRNIEVRIQGQDLEELRNVSLEVKDWMREFPGVTNLSEDLRPGRPEYRIRFRPGILALNLDAQSMASQLRAAFQGQQAAEIQVEGESYEVTVLMNEAGQDAIADLEQFRFVLPSGEAVPLSTVTEIETGRGWARIARVDGQRVVTLRGDVNARKTNTNAILAALRSDMIPVIEKEHPGIQFNFEGEAAEGETTLASMRRAMSVGVVGVFVLLSFQFRSYIEPLIVMVAIPLSLIGVIWGHFLLGYDLSMPSILGFISLAGVVVNDSILLVLFLRLARSRGVDAHDAAVGASRDRFRAILITSLTTVAGLLPLLFEQSLQAQILIPLAISIVFGLLSSTILVLLVIPCLYMVLHDFGLTAIQRSDD